MRRLARILLLILLGLTGAMGAAVSAGYVFLQTDYGKIWLGQTLSRVMSSPTTNVAIDGISGTPPFDLHAASVHIGDAQGQWLDLENAALAINGRALLRGEIVIQELGASTLRLHHMPSEPSTSASASAGSLDLSLPHLPFDISVNDLAVKRLILEQAVLGEAANFTLRAQGRMTKGRADMHLALRRTDDKPGDVSLDLTLAGHPVSLNIKGEVSDRAGILAGSLLQRADHPPLTVSITGGGPINDWHGQVEAKLGPLLLINGDIGIAASEDDHYRFSIRADARQAGLLPPNVAPFVGERLTLDAAVAYDGRNVIRLDRLQISGTAGLISAAGSLEGPSESLSGHARIAITDLRSAGALLRQTASGRLDIDATVGGSLSRPSAKIDVDGHGIQAADFALDRLTAGLQLALSMNGGQRHWQGRARGQFIGLTRVDQPLPSELGQDFDWSFAGEFDEAQGALEIASASVAGNSLRLGAHGRLAPDGSSGSLSLDVASLERFADLARLPELGGTLQLNALVAASPRGATSVELQGGTEALHVGIPAADALFGPRVKLAGKLRRDENGGFSFSDVSVTGADMTLAGHGEAEPDLSRPSGEFNFELQRLADLGPALGTPLQGRLKLLGQLRADSERGSLLLNLDGEGIGTDRLLARRLLAEAQIPDLSRIAGRMEVTAQLPAANGTVPARLEANFAHPAADRWNLSGISVTAAGSNIAGDVDYWTSTGLAGGNLSATIADLTPWSMLVGRPLKGRGKVMLSLAARQGQSAVVKLEASALSIGGAGQRIEIGRIALAANASGLMTTPRGQVDLSVTETTAGALHFDGAKAHFERGSTAKLDFAANATGTYLVARGAPEEQILPIAVEIAGNWRPSAQGQEVSLTRLKTVLAGDSAELLRPLHVAFGRGRARMEDLALNVAGGRLTGTAALDGNGLTAKITGQAIPLKPFGQLAGKPALGTIDLIVDLDGPASAPAGQVTLKGRGLHFVGLGKTAAQLPPLDVAISLVPGNGMVRLQGDIAAQGKQLIAATGTVPLRLSVRPLSVAIPENESVNLKVAGDGRLEKLAEILPMGEDRITGRYRIDLSVAGTPAQPQIAGHIAVTDASYLNQDYGTQLQGFSLELEGDQGRLQLTRLTAGDGKTGRLQGSGSVDLAATPSPMLAFQSKLTHFLIANSDEAQAAVDADIRASGSLAAPKLYARIVLPRGEFRIPDHLPTSIARLDVIEIDSRDPRSSALALKRAKQQTNANPVVPVDLDIEVTVPGQTFVRGHGLDSEWRGKIAVTGNSAAPTVGGSLEAVRGSLSVLGKDFVIRRGTIRFPTGSPSDPWIDLLAEYVASDITAQATFTGQLSAPKLQLSSTPQLPQDEILARVLFNTDAGHITTAQGLQLAFAARTLAGGGPDVLDRLRGTLGLDRLSITNGAANDTPGVTTNRSSQNTTGPALGGGKYIAPGVFVGAEQGADTQSSRAKVEVDILPHATGYSSVGASNSNRVGLDWRMDY